MKKFILAAIAALSVGIGSSGVGSAYAARPVTNHLGQIMNGPAYDSDAAGGS